MRKILLFITIIVLSSVAQAENRASSIRLGSRVVTPGSPASLIDKRKCTISDVQNKFGAKVEEVWRCKYGSKSYRFMITLDGRVADMFQR